MPRSLTGVHERDVEAEGTREKEEKATHASPPNTDAERNGLEEVPRRRAQRRRKNDCCVTNAECARAQIPDAPLPWLRGGPA